MENYNPKDWCWKVGEKVLPVSDMTPEELQQALCCSLDCMERFDSAAADIHSAADDMRYGRAQVKEKK